MGISRIYSNLQKEEEKSRKSPRQKNTWLKDLPRKEKEKEKENKQQQKKQNNINKQTTNQKYSTTTEDIIPIHKQHIKERLTFLNTRYLQIG